MVATVTQLKSSAQAVSYYEKDGYYAKDDPEHRDASFWQGKAARDAGLRGHVLPGEFEDVLDGWVPGTETRLGRQREGEHDRRPGWDITFSAPKSVSLEGLVIGDRRAIRAHDDAVRATLEWIETDLLQTRGWDPITRQRPRVAADGMVVAGFRHLASRGGDPQLHTHCVLANMTRNAAGVWRSVEPTAIRRSEKLIGAYYRNELARRLQSLGMAVTPTLIGRVPGFELAGYEKSFLDAFSGRRAEILAYLEKHELPYNARNAERAALRTRQAKRDVRLSDLVREWRDRANGMGLVRDRGALRPDRPLDPATGERVAPVEVPPPDLPANELRSLRRAPMLPRLPKLPREGWAPSRGPAELSPVPELGVLEAAARAVGLAAVGGLPRQLQRLVERMLAEHRRHLAHDREVRDLVARIQAHWRRWPELGWAAEAQGLDELPEHADWRTDGAALAEAGRLRLAAQGEAGRHLEAMQGVPGSGAGGLAGALAELERIRLLDDAGRFERLWRHHRGRAAGDGVPELLGQGYAEVAALGERLAAADGLDARALNAVAEWRDVHAEQTALAEAVRTLPARAAAWEDRRAEAGAARDAWRRDGRELAALASGMLRAEDPHARWLDAQPGSREGIERAAEAVRETLRDDAWDRFASAAETIDRQWEETGIEPLYLARYPEMIAEARTLDGHVDLSEDRREAVDRRLRYDAGAARLCEEIRDWRGRAEGLLGEMPPPDAELDTLTGWRERAEPLRDEARTMRAPGGAHAQHLDRMPREARALDGAAGRLDAAIADVACAEMGRLMKTARVFAERTGGIRYDAPVHGALMERAHALDAEPGLSGEVRDTVNTLLRYDERVGRDRQRVGAFLAEAAGAADARYELDAQAAMRSMPAEQVPGWDGWREKAAGTAREAKELMDTIPQAELAAHLAVFGAGPDDIGEKEREVRERIARDEQARAAAEAERRAGERRRAAERAGVTEEARTAFERVRAEREEADDRRDREAGKQRNTPAGRYDPRESARAAREAGRLANRLDACIERRDALLERAERRLDSDRPVVDLGRTHSRWRREAGRAIEAGRALLGDARYQPHLDGLGGRTKIEAAVDRLEKAEVLDRLPRRIVAGWEKLEDRVRETGCHRYFLAEHGRLCEAMDLLYPRDDMAHRFANGEMELRKRMTLQAERLDGAAKELEACARERGRAEARGLPFVRQEGYAEWRFRAERAVGQAREILSESSEYAPHFERNPELGETLKTVSDALGLSLRNESADWNRIRDERAEKERQQDLDRSRDRGFSR